jgi:glycosyltransferase involved in cell wall biosynthesis
VKILQIVQKPQRRGAEVFAHQLSKALRNQSHQVHSIYLYPYQGSNGLSVENGDYVLKGQEAHPFEKLPGVHPLLLYRLAQIVNDFQPDVVQVNGASTVKYGAFIRIYQRWRPWVLIYRNIGDPQDWVRGWQRRIFYQRLVMPQVDGVIGVSQATLNTVKTFYQLDVPLRRIPNGVELFDLSIDMREKVRQYIQTPEDSFVLLFVGSLSVEKRVDRLLRVTEKISKLIHNLQVWIVGDGPQREQLALQANAANLNNMVHFLGIQENVASFMAAADLFILTSDTEGIPAVILEAGSQGLPVVATRVGGMSECVLNGETGLLVEPQDEIGMTAAIVALLHDPARRHVMGQTAKTWVRENFAMNKIAQQYLAFYEQVLDQTGKR